MPDGVYAFVVSATDGTRTRFAHASLAVDGTPPVGTVSAIDLVSNATISTNGTVPLRVSWSLSDTASGVASGQLEGMPSGGGWGTVATGLSGGSSTVITGAAAESFRVSGTDAVGNMSTSAVSGPWNIGRFQEGAATYFKSWSTMPPTQNWGSVRYSGKTKAAARFVFTGTDVAWVSTRGPNRGRANVRIDGVLVATIDLYGTTTSARRVVFVASNLAPGEHVMRIIVKKTLNRHRVDIEGFIVLGQ
jgi:hypothetical protein